MRSKNRSPSLSPHRRRLPTSRGSCPSPARPAGPFAGRRGWAGAPARRARRKRPGRRLTARRRGLMMAGSSPWPAACPFVRAATGGRPLEATVQLRCRGPRQSLTLMQRGEESRERKRGRKQRGKEKKMEVTSEKSRRPSSTSTVATATTSTSFLHHSSLLLLLLLPLLPLLRRACKNKKRYRTPCGGRTHDLLVATAEDKRLGARSQAR